VRAGLAVALLACTACTVRIDYGGTGYRCDDGESCPSGQVCRNNRCESGVLPVDAGDPTGDGPARVDAGGPVPWWDPAWMRRRPLVVTNPSQGILPVGFTIGWLVDLTPWSADFDAVRIARWTGAAWEERPRFVDDTAGSASTLEWVWFGLVDPLAPGASTADFWVYYDNPSAGVPPDDGIAVFPVFYDGFSSSSLNTARWEAEDPALVEQTGGALTLKPGASLRTRTAWGPGHAVDFYLNRTASTGATYWGGFQRTSDFMTQPPFAIWIDRAGAGNALPEYTAPPDEWIGNEAAPVEENEHVFSVERFTDRVSFRYEGLPRGEHVLDSALADPLQVRLVNESANPLYSDRVRVRAIVRPEPEVTAGPEEQRP
jgi:hypothetical protein